MLSKPDLMLGQTLVTALCVSVALGANPGCSAIALVGLLAFRVVDKYFEGQKTWSYQTDKALAKLETEVARLEAETKNLKAKTDLKAAFGGAQSARV